PATAPAPPPVVAPPQAAAKPVQTAALIAAPKLRDEVEAKLHSLLGTFQCAELTASLSDDLAARVTGFVGRAEDLDKLRRGLAAIGGIHPVADKVAVYAWPHCAYVKLLAGDASRA